MGNDKIMIGVFEVRVLGDAGVGGAVSVLHPEGETADSLETPSDAEIAEAVGVKAVKFCDSGDHPTRLESIYKIVEACAGASTMAIDGAAAAPKTFKCRGCGCYSPIQANCCWCGTSL